ncbi:MAG TPA: S1/P1 nuclease [Pyrinomonadaceae bacterium]|jgi:hypothetical protein|nr:S1/P1 nuclease [Pyrinomonadaceae bacterium]
MRFFRVFMLAALLLIPQASAFAWHDTGHMLVAQIAYLRLTPAAKARVDKLFAAPQGSRPPLIHLCAGYYMTETCEKLYDPITIAVWMDDFRGDSLNDEYDNWHYVTYRPFFDGTPERTDIGANPENALARINWAINTLRRGTGRDKEDAEVVGFLYHLVGDVHQPLHTISRYTPAQPDGDGDRGGNGFRLQMPPETRVRNLHSFWDAGAGSFGWEGPKRPLDEAARARLRTLADEIMRAHPADADQAWKDVEPLHWIEESNTLARNVVYKNIAENAAPSAAYTEEAQKLVRRRIALAGYRLAEVLNRLFVQTPAPPKPAGQ